MSREEWVRRINTGGQFQRSLYKKGGLMDSSLYQYKQVWMKVGVVADKQGEKATTYHVDTT